MKLPYFPLYVGDYLLGTGELTKAEKGVYVDLLCYQWKLKSLPKSLDRLPVECVDEWPMLEQYFPVCDDGRRRNPRLEEERQKIASLREKQSEGGKKSAEQRKSPTKSLPKTPPNIAESDTYSDSEPDKIKEIVDLLAQILPLFKFKLTNTRKAAFRARGKTISTLAEWEHYFTIIKNSPFLSGDNDRNWKANIDWILKPANMAKILEGNYSHKKKEPVVDPRTQKQEKYIPPKPLTAEEQAETDVARKKALEDVEEWGKKHAVN